VARKVFVTSDMGTDRRLFDVEPLAALLWPWLLSSLDDWGRADADPRVVKTMLFGRNPIVTEEVIASALEQFAAVGLVRLYEHDGRPLVAVPVEKWFRYQTHIRSEKRSNDTSRYPAPPCAESREETREPAESHALPHYTTPRPAHEILAEAATVIAERRGRMDESKSKRNPAAWLRSAIAHIARELEDKAMLLMEAEPSMTGDELADALEPPGPSGKLPAWEPYIVEDALPGQKSAGLAHSLRETMALAGKAEQ